MNNTQLYRDFTKHNFDKPRFNTIEAASFIGCSPYTLRRSRSTGLLFGVACPAYVKRGRNVCYEHVTLEAWLAQFEERTSTANGAA